MGRDQGDIAERGAAEVGHHRASRGGGALHLPAKIFHLLVGDGCEFFEVIVGIQPVLVYRRLAHDGVEEIAIARHAAAGRDAGVALGIDERVAAGIHGDAEVLRDQNLETIRHAPRLPIVVREAEHRLAGEHALDVEPQRALQIVLDQPEHLVRLVDFDGAILQPEVPAKPGHAGGVHAGNAGAAEIDRHAVRLAMVQCG
jgi:hypothetical protein